MRSHNGRAGDTRRGGGAAWWGSSASAATIGDSRDTRSVGTGPTASDGVGEGDGEGMGSGPLPSIGNAADTETPQLELVPQLLAAIAIFALVVPLLISLVLYGFETVVEFVRSVLQTTTGVIFTLSLGVVIYLLSLLDGEGAAKRVSARWKAGQRVVVRPGARSRRGPSRWSSSRSVALSLLVVIALLVVRSTSGPSLDRPETEPVAEEGVRPDSSRSARGRQNCRRRIRRRRRVKPGVSGLARDGRDGRRCQPPDAHARNRWRDAPSTRDGP